MNYKAIIEELADRSARRRQDVRGTVRVFCLRLVCLGRARQWSNGNFVFRDGSVLRADRLHFFGEVSWL